MKEQLINNYKIIVPIGQGSYGQVNLCEDTNTGIKYAIKQMNKKFLKRKCFPNGKTAYELVLDELKILQKIQHPNIIWLPEIIDDPKKESDLYIVTDYHQNGSLAN